MCIKSKSKPNLSIYLSIYPSIFLSIYISFYPSNHLNIYSLTPYIFHYGKYVY